ncbi:MAG: hypothetical protein IJ081_06705 [Prevotella sp.]|nr:hypothetical protein [Prevotella sp.]
MKRLFLFLIAALGIMAPHHAMADDLPKNGMVMNFKPFDSKYGPFYDQISRQTLQVYDISTGELRTAPKREKEGFFGDYDWGFLCDSCKMFDTDLKLGSKMTILVRFKSNNNATTRGPIALMRKGQPDSLWYFPISIEKNRMIYMEGKPSPEDSAMVRSRWHYDIENGGHTAVFVLIDFKSGRHEVYTQDSASVFYNTRLSELAEQPNRLLFTQQEEMLINEFAVWNRLLTKDEILFYYHGKKSKDHELMEPVPIVGNVEEADGVIMHGWNTTRWVCVAMLVTLFIIWLIRRFRNINVHYSFSGSPLIILAGIFGTWYLQSNLDTDVENMWIYNLVNILTYYFISFRADPMYTIRNAGGVGSVINYVGGVFAMLGEVLDSIPHTMWEVTYVNRRTGEKRTQIERHNNIIISIFWIVVIIFVIWLFIIFSQLIYQILPFITLCKFIMNFFKERSAFKEARQYCSQRQSEE